jgi:hypothetical protein
MRCILLAAILCACSSAPGIDGLYQVTSASSNSMGCGNETPVSQPPAYFLIKKDSLLGATLYALQTCTSMDTSTCTGGSGLYTDGRDDGWHGYLSFYSGDSSDCDLGYIDYAALFDPTPDKLRVTMETHTMTGPVSDCSTKHAEAIWMSMPCVQSSTLTGTLVK